MSFVNTRYFNPAEYVKDHRDHDKLSFKRTGRPSSSLNTLRTHAARQANIEEMRVNGIVRKLDELEHRLGYRGTRTVERELELRESVKAYRALLQESESLLKGWKAIVDQIDAASATWAGTPTLFDN